MPKARYLRGINLFLYHLACFCTQNSIKGGVIKCNLVCNILPTTLKKQLKLQRRKNNVKQNTIRKP